MKIPSKNISNFYSLLFWAEKTNFLQSCIETFECKQRRKPENRKNIRFKKSFTRIYFFSDKEKKVCKSFFEKVLQISEGRLEKCAQKKQNMSVSNIADLRGKHTSHKKTPAERVKEVIEFVNLLPHYESHYTRAAMMGTNYLSPNLNLTILYKEYVKLCTEKKSIPVSKYMFRDIFYRKFNLKFKPPAQDTCDYCNRLEMKIEAAVLKSDERISLMDEKVNHLQCIEYITREYNEHVVESKLSVAEKIVLVYDLEKMFETPKLSTNSAKKCKELILYSDSTGVQNRNIKTSTMLSHYLEKCDHLRTITQHFYRPGHSYNVCDRKFGVIERSRKKSGDIYVPSQWKEVVANSKTTDPKFIVTELNGKHFLNCDKLLSQFCTNRKKSVNNEQVNWFTFREIMLMKGQPLHLFVETYDDINLKYDESLEFTPNNTKQISVIKKGFKCDDFIGIELPLLYPQGRPIASAKKVDLMELLEFIPQEHHEFYAALDHTDMDPNDIIVLSNSDEEENDSQ